LRQFRGLSRDELARALGAASSVISPLECGYGRLTAECGAGRRPRCAFGRRSWRNGAPTRLTTISLH